MKDAENVRKDAGIRSRVAKSSPRTRPVTVRLTQKRRSVATDRRDDYANKAHKRLPPFLSIAAYSAPLLVRLSLEESCEPLLQLREEGRNVSAALKLFLEVRDVIVKRRIFRILWGI